MSSRPVLDLRLYLVTDSTPAILGGKDLVRIVEEAVKGGVTIVQYRDKHADTQHMVDVATKLHHVTKKYKVPLLINDRLDICIAVGAEGIHVGQNDMHISEARKSLGDQAIIGVTVASIEEANEAIQAGANYLGIGTMFATPTKTDTQSIIGTRGTKAILEACKTGTLHDTSCVAIGGINASNIQRVKHQSCHLGNNLNGVAVVSAVIASPDPRASASYLLSLFDSANRDYYVACPPSKPAISDLSSMLKQIPSIVKSHVSSSILCHNMTNTVVQNFAANVCLATGSSPIMSLNGAEAIDLAKLRGALVVNMGTVTPDLLQTYLMAMRAYNSTANPVLFDPVGGGATRVRKDAFEFLMANGFFDVIKGNEGEIAAIIGNSDAQQHGVDSGTSSTTPGQKAAMVKALSRRENCIVLMTGATDYLSDGYRTLAISNGSHYLGKITGSGCALGSVVASYVAVHREDKLVAALAALLHYEIAAERAEERDGVKGPGTFQTTFLDELYVLGKTVKEGGNVYFNKRAKIQWVDVA